MYSAFSSPWVRVGIWFPLLGAVLAGFDTEMLWFVDGDEYLRKRITQHARAHYVPPEDAYVDKIWKAVPGLNGYRIDEEATFQRTKQSRGRGIVNVWRSIPPVVQLHSLSALPVYRGNPRKNAVGLMFNVAWGTEHLDGILRILQHKGLRATFFLDGFWLKDHPVEARRLLDGGHEIGNHGYNHSLLEQADLGKITRTMQRTRALLQEMLGIRSYLFAPPAGSFDQRTVDEARRQGMVTILWSCDTVDWRKDATPERIINRVGGKIQSGSLILMHPTPSTVRALPAILSLAQDRHLRMGSVGEVLSSDYYLPAMDPAHGVKMHENSSG
ncbi:polysaccharide deacetylase family protein [Pasteuria penetrans]|uniref:polysaccharide deacetylase family protein n=1 Tax=Pasteuria penetrans TaxID=86005 RepID=UPI000FA7FE24|nr:polysaccharide deacetylase family protein [Pasteuria penetrans]